MSDTEHDSTNEEEDGAPVDGPDESTDGGSESTSGEDAEQTPESAEPQPEPESAAAEQAEPAQGSAPQEGTEEEAAPADAADAPVQGSAPQEGTEDEAAPTGPPAASEKKGDVVPGANLEPIAITEERELTAEERAALEAEEEERASREAAARDDDDDELPSRSPGTVPADLSIQATGKRKSSVARVLLRAGSGTIEINGRQLDEYFPRPHHQSLARQPLVTAGYDSNVEVRIRVHGGGVSGQAGAVRHGIARALVELDSELRGDLKRRGMLTRDDREKERRKAGLKKARKKPQFSKR